MQPAINAITALESHRSGAVTLHPAAVETLRILIEDESRRSFFFFARYVLGYDRLTPETHARWARDLIETLPRCERLARLKPRTTFKTTLYGISFSLWLWAIDKKIRLLYTSANELLLTEVSEEFSRFIGRPRKQPDSLYSFVFGVKRDRAAKNDMMIFNIDGRGDEKGHSLAMMTSGSGKTGVHPNIIIIDDPCDEECREKPTIRDRRYRFLMDLVSLLGPREIDLPQPDGSTIRMTLGHMILVATRWHYRDATGKVIEKENWDSVVEGVFGDDGTPRYPEFLPADAIQKLKDELPTVTFACQYLNNPLPGEIATFQKERIQRFDPHGDLPDGAVYCFLDPSSGKEKRDFPAVLWVLHAEKRIYILDAANERTLLGEMIVNEIIPKNREYGVREMYVETVGVTLFREFITLTHEQAGVPMSIEEFGQSKNKHDRIQSTQPFYTQGRILLRSDAETAYPECWDQITMYPAYGYVDYPDLMEAVARILLVSRYTPAAVPVGGTGHAQNLGK